MDALQADIDNLETEKLDLKKKLDNLSKKSLLQDLARQTSGIGALVAGKLHETRLYLLCIGCCKSFGMREKKFFSISPFLLCVRVMVVSFLE